MLPSDFMLTPEYSTLLLAGHDTTANTLTWFLWEVAKHPESQDRIRAEIKAVRAQNGEERLSPADLDNMVYTQAALKVRLISLYATQLRVFNTPRRSR